MSTSPSELLSAYQQKAALFFLDNATESECSDTKFNKFGRSLFRRSLSETSTIASTNSIDADDFVCVTCGNPFFIYKNSMNQMRKSQQRQHPTHQKVEKEKAIKCYNKMTKIRVRSLNRGKSRRRRASRLKAKEMHSEGYQGLKFQHGGKQFSKCDLNTQSHGSTMASIVHNQEMSRKSRILKRVGDGMSRQSVVYTCGHCHFRTRFKGLPVKADILSTNPLTVQTGRMYKKMISSVPQNSKAKKIHFRKETDLNFLPLSLEHMPSQTSTKIDKNKVAIPDKCKPILVRGLNIISKRRKKKGNPALRDFLSSLND